MPIDLMIYLTIHLIGDNRLLPIRHKRNIPCLDKNPIANGSIGGPILIYIFLIMPKL